MLTDTQNKLVDKLTDGFVISPCFLFAIKGSGLEDEKLEQLIGSILEQNLLEQNFEDIDCVKVANRDLFESIQCLGRE